jgi:hypothetical protein
MPPSRVIVEHACQEPRIEMVGCSMMNTSSTVDDVALFPNLVVSEDAHAAFSQALEAGAEEIQAPERMSEGVTTALIRAPGGVPIGLSGP